MRRAGPLHLAAFGVLLAATAVLLGCGGSESEPLEEEVSPDSVLACIENEGLDAELVPFLDDSGATSVVVDVRKNAGVIATFFDDPAEAQTYVESENLAAETGLNNNETEFFNPTTAVRTGGPGDLDDEREVVIGCLS